MHVTLNRTIAVRLTAAVAAGLLLSTFGVSADAASLDPVIAENFDTAAALGSYTKVGEVNWASPGVARLGDAANTGSYLLASKALATAEWRLETQARREHGGEIAIDCSRVFAGSRGTACSLGVPLPPRGEQALVPCAVEARRDAHADRL